MRKAIIYGILLLVAACGQPESTETKVPTLEEITKEANAWREKNMDKLTAFAVKIDSMLGYVKGVTDSLVMEDTTSGVGTSLAFRNQYGEEAFNCEVLHLRETDTNVMGHFFMENDWFENVYDFAKNGFTAKQYEAKNTPAPYWSTLKENIDKAINLEFVVLYRTVFLYEPKVAELNFEMGMDFENAFLFSLKDGKLIRQFNLLGVNDQEVMYNQYPGDESKTQDSYRSAIKSNFYKKLRESMEKTLKDRFEVKGDVRKFYETF